MCAKSARNLYQIDASFCRRAYPIDDYPARTRHAAAIMHMIMNNLDPRVAQFPHELVTYGGNGQVFSNWAQVRDAELLSDVSTRSALGGEWGTG